MIEQLGQQGHEIRSSFLSEKREIVSLGACPRTLVFSKITKKRKAMRSFQKIICIFVAKLSAHYAKKEKRNAL